MRDKYILTQITDGLLRIRNIADHVDDVETTKDELVKYAYQMDQIAKRLIEKIDTFNLMTTPPERLTR